MIRMAGTAFPGNMLGQNGFARIEPASRERPVAGD
jgi:hypothetical protein